MIKKKFGTITTKVYVFGVTNIIYITFFILGIQGGGTYTTVFRHNFNHFQLCIICILLKSKLVILIFLLVVHTILHFEPSFL